MSEKQDLVDFREKLDTLIEDFHDGTWEGSEVIITLLQEKVAKMEELLSDDMSKY